VWRSWNALAQNTNPAGVLRVWVEEAVAKDKQLIRNDLERKARNG